MAKIIIVCGQTATGKSNLAIDIAEKLNGEIISADSRQVYTGLHVCSNQVTSSEMRGIPHYMMNIVSLHDKYTVAQYQNQARSIIADIIARGKTPIICGGTGLYIDATVFAGFNFAHEGSLNYEGADYWDYKDPSPDQERKGAPPSQFSDLSSPNYIWIGLHNTRDVLVPAIAQRAHSHYEPVIAEITKLLRSGIPRDRLYGLGLEPKLAIDVIEGTITPAQYTNLLTIKTWQYAKRQMTWFKRNPNIHWFLSTERDQALEFAVNQV